MKVGLEVEEIVDLAASVSGPLVLGRVQEIEELTGFKKPIRYCQVDVGTQTRGIICGATNFVAGDLVVVALPGAVLPGGFAISARKTYGRVSDGMICSARELGIGEDHSGTLVLPPDAGSPGDDARPAIGLDDVVVELNITPDRGYCFSVRGIARELASSLGVPFRDPAAMVDPAGATTEAPYPVRVEDQVGCDRFAARVVRGVDPLAESPGWLRRRLEIAGIRSTQPPRRHHQLPDARARTADARLRPRPVVRPAGSAPGTSGGAAGHAGRRAARPRSRGSGDLRRHRTGVAGRGHGW